MYCDSKDYTLYHINIMYDNNIKQVAPDLESAADVLKLTTISIGNIRSHTYTYTRTHTHMTKARVILFKGNCEPVNYFDMKKCRLLQSDCNEQLPSGDVDEI